MASGQIFGGGTEFKLRYLQALATAPRIGEEVEDDTGKVKGRRGIVRCRPGSVLKPKIASLDFDIRAHLESCLEHLRE